MKDWPNGPTVSYLNLPCWAASIVRVPCIARFGTAQVATIIPKNRFAPTMIRAYGTGDNNDIVDHFDVFANFIILPQSTVWD